MSVNILNRESLVNNEPSLVSGGLGSGGGSDKNFIFTQITPALVWNVNHDLDKFTSVTVVNSSNVVFQAQVVYIDTNNVIITFNSPFAGKAYLN